MNWEDYRFDCIGNLLYPNAEPEKKAPVMRHMGVNARAEWSKGVTLSVDAGRMVPVADGGETRDFLRLLAQYNAEPGEMGLHLFARLDSPQRKHPTAVCSTFREQHGQSIFSATHSLL